MIVSSARLARNVGYNLAGNAAPILVALVSIPLLISGLGAERFGILTLAWAAIGYFSLFDLGIGRALTQELSTAIAARRTEDVAPVTWTGLFLMLLLGSAGGVALALAAGWLISDVLRIPAALERETVIAFRLLALSLPLVVTTAGLRGILEAHQDFGIATALRLPYAVFTFLGPLLVLPYSASLVAVVGVLVVARVVLWAAHVVVIRRTYAPLRGRPVFTRRLVAPLLRTGGWMTVSNVVSPLMVNVDRFLIAGLIGAGAVAHYVTPYEVATKVLLIPGALINVLFPAFASSFAIDPRATARRAEQAVRLLVAVIFPIALLLVALAPEGLRLWVGVEFARAGAPVLQWLAAGVLINAIGIVPFGVLQAVGRSDLTAKLHLLEVPLYFAALFLLGSRFGVAGVAMAWTLRVAFDTTVLLTIARRLLPAVSGEARAGTATFVGVLAALAVVGAIGPLLIRLGVTAAVMIGFAVYAWTRLVRPAERDLLRLARSGRAASLTS